MNSDTKSDQSTPEFPSGTVTFLFTDIEGSTELLKQLGEEYKSLLSNQRKILRDIFSRWNGKEVDTQGDAFFYSFSRATEAVSAAVEAQRAIASHTWPEGAEVQVRMGLHTGEPWRAEDGYVGMDVHRAARIAHAGHGGQVLLSETTAALMRDELQEDVGLLDLGRHRLKDMRAPERIRQLTIEGLPSEFPPLTSLEALPPEIPFEAGPIQLPSFLEEGEEAPTTVFVGRERQMVRLDEYLTKALEGDGQVVFVTGGPGRGKTALLDAFARRAMAAYEDLLVVNGECSAHTGAGDPYLPFRGALEMLTGDVGARWTSGRISRECAIRLWETMPKVIREIVEYGPDLIDVFVSGRQVLRRTRQAVEGGSGWLERLATISEGDRISPGELEQRNLFEQVEEVLGGVAERYPLVLVLDDLQWADSASINLLFHLGRNLKGKRLFILCAYRPEEVGVGREDKPHPLEKVLSEFKRLYGDVWVDLSETEEEEGKIFVEAFLETEKNRLTDHFRQALFEHTGGHPLFTVELLRALQERGDLIQDGEGFWIEGPELDWSTVPPRVEGVIEERIGRLKETLRETLSIASVQGEDFTAQVVARVQQVGEKKLIRRLSRELEKKHRLVQAQDEVRVGATYLSHYRFTHFIFQRFLYNDLSAAERRTMHGEVARVLEELYAGDKDTITVQLANHYTEAGEAEEAIEYLQAAGDRARLVFANEEAIKFYERALAFQKEMSYDDQSARTLMKLGLTYHNAFDYKRSRVAFDEAFALRQQGWTSRPKTLEPSPHRFRLVSIEPRNLDPMMGNDLVSLLFTIHLFSGLAELSQKWEVIPDVAKSWEISEDGRRYIINLRDDVYWSDGIQVTADDFEYSWKRTLDPATKAPNEIASQLYDIKNAKAYNKGEISEPDKVGLRIVDKITLEVELERPTSFFLQSLPLLYPIPRHVVEAQDDAWTNIENIVTNGAFQLETFEPMKRIILVRNPTYHGEFTGNLEGVEITLVDSDTRIPSESVELYAENRVDIAFLNEQTYHARHRYAEDYISYPSASVYIVGFNVSRPPLNDPRIRRALAMAVDKESLAGEALGGFMDPATGGFIPPTIPGHASGISLPYDPDHARHLMAQAGYPNGQGFPTLEFLVPYVSEPLENLKVQWLDKLKVRTKIEITDVVTCQLNLHRRHAYYLGLATVYPDPGVWLDEANQQLFPHWQNDKYDQLLEEARRTFGQQDRIRLYQEADKILVEEAVVLPLTYFRERYLVKNWVQIPAGMFPCIPPLKDVIIEPH